MVRALRYYEKAGLVVPARSTNGYRPVPRPDRHPGEVLDWLRARR
jgi:MerR family regulatory protein